jgi:hypothetical protein
MSMIMNKHEAIYKTYPTVVSICDEIAYDEHNNVVHYNEATVQSYIDAHAYKSKRQAEYPPITDYLDGIVKGDQAQIAKYIADCQAIKTKYPKA